MRIKKREVLFSVIIVLVMIFIGIFVSDAILQGAVSKSESYRTATVIENTDQFYYGMDTRSRVLEMSLYMAMYHPIRL